MDRVCHLVNVVVQMDGKASYVISVNRIQSVFMVRAQNPGNVNVTPHGQESIVTKVIIGYGIGRL